jgi:hypothetical protein
MSKAIDTFISRYWHNFPKIRLTYTNNISEALSENLKSWIESSKSCVNSIAKKICCKKQDVDEVVKGVRYQELDSCSFHSEHNPISADEGGLSGAAVRRATDDAAEAAARYAAAAPASTRSAYWGSGIGLIISTIFFGALITTATLTGKCADDILAKLDNSIGNNNDIADKYTIDSNNIYSFKNNQVGDEIKMTVTTTTDGKPVDIKDVDKIEWSINENSLPYIRLSDAHNSSTTTLKLILVPPVDVKVLLTVAISTKTGKHYIAQFAFNITVTS